jgi:hypothetical protein
MQTRPPSVLPEKVLDQVSRSTIKTRITMTRMLIAAEASWFKCRMPEGYSKSRNKKSPRRLDRGL